LIPVSKAADMEKQNCLLSIAVFRNRFKRGNSSVIQ
jgi:hypothetical protein